MDRNDEAARARAAGSHNGVQRSLDYLRQRSLHRVWCSSARVALRRGQSGEPLSPPIHGPRGPGKPV